MIKVLCIWEMSETLRTYLLKQLSDKYELVIVPGNDKQRCEEEVRDAQVIIGWRPWTELLENAKQLRLFINPGAGVEHLIPTFSEYFRDVVLVNGHGNAYFTATHAVALFFAINNKIVVHDTWMRSGTWRKGDSDAKSLPMKRRIIGFYGFGAINQWVCEFFSSWDIEFVVYTRTGSFRLPSRRLLQIKDRITAVASLDELFAKSTDVIIAVPLTEKTRESVRYEQLSLLGENGLLVNVGRGPVIAERDLYESLANSEIGGAAIDVWYNYNPDEVDGKRFPYTYPFHELSNVVLSPHRAASPFDDLERWDEVVQNLLELQNSSPKFINVIDVGEGY